MDNNSYNEDLVEAACRGGLKDVRSLLDAGADINHRDRYGRTALIRASREGYGEIVDLLLQKGAQVNLADAYGDTPLTEAAISGWYEIVETLLNKGADPGLANSRGKRAIDVARDKDIQKLLRSKSSSFSRLFQSFSKIFKRQAESPFLRVKCSSCGNLCDTMLLRNDNSLSGRTFSFDCSKCHTTFSIRL